MVVLNPLVKVYLIRGVASFQGSRLEGVHRIAELEIPEGLSSGTFHCCEVYCVDFSVSLV